MGAGGIEGRGGRMNGPHALGVIADDLGDGEDDRRGHGSVKASFFSDLRAIEGLALTFTFKGFAPRRIGLSLPLILGIFRSCCASAASGDARRIALVPARHARRSVSPPGR
jgi:hypothetical protein